MTTFLGQKIGMTQVFAPDGGTVAVTLVRVPEAYVTQIKTADKDGYLGVQVGTDVVDDKKAERKINKPQREHLKKAQVMARRLYEYRVDKEEEIKDLKVGQDLKLDVFSPGDAVQIRGTSKGCGFAGVVKRHHFRGGRGSHGDKDNLRAPGSIGAQQPQHVWPGTRMAGQMGNEAAFIKNVEVYKIDLTKRLLILKGGVPGAIHSWVAVKTTGKKVDHPISERKAVGTSQSQDGEAKGKKAEKKAESKEAKEEKPKTESAKK